MSSWTLGDNLRAEIITAAEESQTRIIEINFAKIGAKLELSAEMITLLPPIKIEGTKPIASLIANSWERSGLITAASTSGSPSPKHPQQKQTCIFHLSSRNVLLRVQRRMI